MRQLLFLLLLGSFLHAADTNVIMTNGCISNTTEIIFIEQGTLIFAVIAFTIVLIALTYMLGTAMHEAKWVVFAKDEIYHLGFSILMLIAFAGIMVGTCVTMEGFFKILFNNYGAATLTSGCFTSSSTMHETANCYLNKLTFQGRALSQAYIQKQINEMMDSTFSWSFALPLVNSYTLSGDSYRRIDSSQYETIMNMFLVPSVLSLSMQQIMLNFIKENIIEWVLPIAFLLRIFIPTRQMGDMLIALVIGIYIIIPFMYVFNFSMYDVISPQTDCPNYASAVCDRVVDGNCGNPETTCTNPLGFWAVGRLIPFAFFLPNLTMVIFIAFMSAVHKGLRAIG